MLSCSIWFSAPSLWMGGGLESRCVGRLYGADGAVRLTSLHQVGISDYFMRKMHGQTSLKLSLLFHRAFFMYLLICTNECTIF